MNSYQKFMAQYHGKPCAICDTTVDTWKGRLMRKNKKCKSCGELKYLSLFHKSGLDHGKQMYRPSCIECTKSKRDFGIIKCLTCNTSFTKKNYQQKYCCEFCRKTQQKSKRKKIKFAKCAKCGKEFEKKYTSKYCSYDCKAEHYREKRILKYSKTDMKSDRKCRNCGKIYKPKSAFQKFCSFDCQKNKKKSKISRRWSIEKAEKRKGQNNPAYKHGLRSNGKKIANSREFTRNSKNIKEQIINTVGYLMCEHCKTSNSLRFETHHIIYRREKPKHENLHKKENLIVLCIQCHNDFHKYKPKRNYLVRERKLNELFGDDVLDKVGANDSRI